MQVDTQRFLELAEATGSLVSWDIEATGLRGDYNGILCVSVRPFGRKPITFAVDKPGRDKDVVIEAAEFLRKADCWTTYYGKGFDYPMINTRLLKWGQKPLERKPHLDMYYFLKSKILTARRSQAHLLDWLKIEHTGESTDRDNSDIVHKMSVSADEWNEVLADPKKVMPIMIKRCESDTYGLENLYRRTKHLITDIRS